METSITFFKGIVYGHEKFCSIYYHTSYTRTKQKILTYLLQKQ